jgi:hypothetical protein
MATTATPCTTTRWPSHELTVAPSLSLRVEPAALAATVSVRSAAPSWKLRNKEKSKLHPLLTEFYSIERDAQLLANRIALLKQEEMRTWKKIEETKKRATEVVTLK